MEECTLSSCAVPKTGEIAKTAPTKKGIAHNNAAELEIRDAVVLHRNVCHRLSEPEGQEIFSVLISVARTCHKQGIFPRIAVEGLIMESGLEHIQTH